MSVRCRIRLINQVECKFIVRSGRVKCVLKETERYLLQCELYILKGRSQVRRTLTNNGELVIRKRQAVPTKGDVSQKRLKRTMITVIASLQGACNKNINLTMEATISIKDLKEMIIERIDGEHALVIFFKGKKLKDETRTLEDYSVQDGMTLSVGVPKKNKAKQPRRKTSIAPPSPPQEYVRTAAPASDLGVIDYVEYFEKNEERFKKAVAEYLSGEEDYDRPKITEEEVENIDFLAERLWKREGPALLPNYISGTKLARPCKYQRGLVRWFPIGRLVYYPSFDELPDVLPREWGEYVWDPESTHFESASQMYVENKKRWYTYGLFYFYCGVEDNLKDEDLFAKWFRGMVMRAVANMYDEQLLGETLYYDFDVNLEYERKVCYLLWCSHCMYYAPDC